MDFEEELKRRNIGFCVYCNLDERRKVHIDIGYDRYNDDAEVGFFKIIFETFFLPQVTK